MELKEYVGNQIKFFRKSKKMTQSELAELLDTTKQTISRYEKGERKANQDMLFKLCDIFGVTIDDFFPQKHQDVSTPPLKSSTSTVSYTNLVMLSGFQMVKSCSKNKLTNKIQ